MSKNIAIFLGVGEYQGSALCNLPCVANDVSLMEFVLQKSGVVYEFIHLESKDAQSVMEQLLNTINQFKGQAVDRVFFYFSGHGDADENTSYFLLNDYCESKRASTSLHMDRLLDMFRELKPEFLVIAVDACNSAERLIKSASGGNIFPNLSNHARGLKNLFFMCSSQQNQFSYASGKISFFTNEIAKAIANSTLDVIRCSYMQDFLTDAFSEQEQTPGFQYQGDGSQSFGAFSPEARAEIEAKVEQFESLEVSPVNAIRNDANVPLLSSNSVQNSVSTSGIVEVTSKNYQQQFSADQLSEIKVLFEKFSVNPVLKARFDIDREWFEDYRSLPRAEYLARWLERHSSEKFFAKVDKFVKEEAYDPITKISLTNSIGSSSILGYFNKRNVTTYVGWEATVQGMPFVALEVVLSSKESPDTRYSAWFTYLISRSQVKYFSAFVAHREVSWGKFEIGEMSNWMVHDTAPHLGKLGEWENVITGFYEVFGDWICKRESLS